MIDLDYFKGIDHSSDEEEDAVHINIGSQDNSMVLLDDV